MDDIKVYMAILISRRFELENEYILMDNYYDCITHLSVEYLIQQHKHLDNMSLLDSINKYIDDNLIKIENALVRYEISDTKKWGV